MNDLAINEPLALELFAGEAKTVKKDGNDKTVWECARFELDALTSEQVVNLVEEGLSAEGVYGKVIPPADELPALSVDIYRQMHRDWVVEALSELTSLPEIQKQLADEFIEKFKLANSERYINARLKQEDTLSWRNALKNVLGDIQEAKHTDALKEAVRGKVVEALKEA